MNSSTNVTPVEQKIRDAESPSLAIPPSRSEKQLSTTAGVEALPLVAESQTDVLPQSVWPNWNKLHTADISSRLLDHVIRLAMVQPGWGGVGSQPLEASSLKTFLSFWASVRDLAVEPEITLAPDGSLYAEWFKSDRQHLDMKFTKNRIFWGLFAPQSIVEGVDDMKTVVSILRSHRAAPLLWKAAK